MDVGKHNVTSENFVLKRHILLKAIRYVSHAASSKQELECSLRVEFFKHQMSKKLVLYSVM